MSPSRRARAASRPSLLCPLSEPFLLRSLLTGPSKLGRWGPTSWCGSTVVFVDEQHQAELWDLDSRTRVWKSGLPGQHSIICMAFSPQNDFVAWLGYTNSGLLDAISGESLITWDSIGWPTSVTWAGDG